MAHKGGMCHVSVVRGVTARPALAAMVAVAATSGGLWSMVTGAQRPASAQTPSLAVGVALDDGDATASDLDAFASVVGRKPTIVQWYQAWSEPIFYSAQMTAVSQRGELPLITWDPATGSGNIPLTDITAGTWDSYLDQQAAAVKGTNQIRLHSLCPRDELEQLRSDSVHQRLALCRQPIPG